MDLDWRLDLRRIRRSGQVHLMDGRRFAFERCLLSDSYLWHRSRCQWRCSWGKQGRMLLLQVMAQSWQCICRADCRNFNSFRLLPLATCSKLHTTDMLYICATEVLSLLALSGMKVSDEKDWR